MEKILIVDDSILQAAQLKKMVLVTKWVDRYTIP